MPRLVALTMLSLLTIPAAGLVYLITIVVGDEVLDVRYRNYWVLFVVANVLSFLTLVGGFTLIWWRRVEWTPARLIGSGLVILGSVVIGAVIGTLAGALASEDTFGHFTGGTTAMVLWLIATCLLWQERTPALASPQGTKHAIDCPECGYSMKGLQGTRCPECGKLYTLDELLAVQRTPTDLA